MSIPNISSLYQRINKGSEGGNEFARLMNYLLIAEAKEEGAKTKPYSDASGDYKGLDAFTELDLYQEGFQFKFFPSPLSASHKGKIIESIKLAMEEATENLRTLYIVTPEDLMKHDKEWFEMIKKDHERKEKVFEDSDLCSVKTTINHWGHTRIVELMLRHPHIGKHYFPELFPYEVDLFKIGIVEIDDRNFIFDFSFLNDSTYTYLLNRIQLIRLETWSSLSGLPEKYYLKSLGELKFKVDMKKKTNSLSLSNPIIFKPNFPMRFKIQLLNFPDTCPGSGAKIKFRFLFNDQLFFMETKPFILNV